MIAGLLPPARGTIRLGGEALAGTAAARTREQLRRIQIVFQMPDTALNPAHTVARILGRPLVFYHGLSGAAIRRRTAELLDLVHLPATPCRALSGRALGRAEAARQPRARARRRAEP